MIERDLGGKRAECADAEKYPNNAGNRCLLDGCRNCQRKLKNDAREKRKIEAAARRLAGAQKEAPGLKLVDPGPEIAKIADRAGADLPVIDSSLVHKTNPKAAPLPSAPVALPIDWDTFGPSNPAPDRTPEEQEQDTQAQERAERLENPGEIATMFAAGVAMLMGSCGDAMAAMGKPGLRSLPEGQQQAIIAVCHASALESGALLFPNVEKPWWSCHAVTAMAIGGSVVPVYYARRELASGGPPLDSELAQEQQEQEQETTIIDTVGTAPVSEDEAFAGIL